MKWKIDNNLVVFEGSLNESSNFSEFSKDTIKIPLDVPIILDFSNILYANSAGISSYVKFLQSFNGLVNYVNTPYWMVNYLNLIPELIDGKNKVISIQVPYYAKDSSEDLVVTFEIGKDIPVLDTYKDYELATYEKDGDTYIPDIVPEIYFGFISHAITLYFVYL